MTICSVTKSSAVTPDRISEDDLFPLLGVFVDGEDNEGEFIVLFIDSSDDYGTGVVLVSHNPSYDVGDMDTFKLNEYEKYGKPVTIRNK